jgi:mono/diheme cytochrome c family protein
MLHSFIARLSVLALALGPALGAWAATPAELRAEYAAKAASPPSAERGQKFFVQKFGRDYENCAECHGAVPVSVGKDLVSGKRLEPLAPAANPARLTDRARVEYMFRMNCKDVVGRECTAQEKADVLTWLISLKP